MEEDWDYPGDWEELPRDTKVEHQLYPFSQGDFAREVRERLELKVDSPKAIQAGTVERLSKWAKKGE